MSKRHDAMSELALKTERLTKRYRGAFWRLKTVPSLDELTLEIERGMVFGFLGRNGAGKTTTIRCLIDLIRPTSGRAWVLGHPCGDVRIRERIGYLPDAPSFGTHLTAQQFLLLCTKLLKIPKTRRHDKVAEVLATVHMSEHGREPIGEFSRGMIQRIGIAQALLNDPDLLILDEPLVGLDPHGRRELLEIVLDQKKRGTTVFFCSHILSDVEKLCDNIGILNRGKLLCTGPLKTLLAAKGVSVTVPADAQSFIQRALPESDANEKLDDGRWRLAFQDAEKWDLLAAAGTPAGVGVEPCNEGLEALFFRMTKAADEREQAGVDVA